MASRSLGLLLLLLLSGCAAGLQRFPLKEPMARDDDQRPVKREPKEYYSPLIWDAVDQTVFRPITRFFAVDAGGEAINVNALDEVPDSSWFQNRIASGDVETLTRGPCELPPLDPDKGFTVVGAKPNGANPGFTVEVDGKKYMMKFEHWRQAERATSADVMGSRIYHAAGFNGPCNRVVFFRRDQLKIKPGVTGKDATGKKVKITPEVIAEMLKNVSRTADGRYRASVSLFLEGKPLGPFRFHGTRKDDPNDVVPHEDRRELRASKLLAAWISHFDAREQNSLDMWIEVPGGGIVRHHFLDWGDCFGSLVTKGRLAPRIGHTYYLHFGHILADLISFGVPQRPWDGARFGPAGAIWGYFNIEDFVPDAWLAGYPNPAFNRMTEHDAAWMARIMAHFSDELVRSIMEEARIQNPVSRRELLRTLLGRRDKILRRYLGSLSALAKPRLVQGDAGQELCLEDLAVRARIAERGGRQYGARAWSGPRLQSVPMGEARLDGELGVCVSLPRGQGATIAAPVYLIVDVDSHSPRLGRLVPARVHLYDLGGGQYRVVGLERPSRGTAPRA